MAARWLRPREGRADSFTLMKLVGRRSETLTNVSACNAGPVAQRLEQGTHNPLAGGSNPSGPTIQIKSIERISLLT